MDRFILVFFAVASSVAGQVPIPKAPVGFAYKDGCATAQVQLEVYIDLVCPDSQAAWPTMKQVAAHYGDSRLRLLVHQFPLPFHRNAFIASQGAYVVNYALKDVNAAFDFIDAMFSVQPKFANSDTLNMTEKAILNSLASVAKQATQIDTTSFLNGMNSGMLDDMTRLEWKYGCTRGVAGTPTFFVNGISVAAKTTWTLKEWQDIIDPLFQSNN